MCEQQLDLCCVASKLENEGAFAPRREPSHIDDNEDGSHGFEKNYVH